MPEPTVLTIHTDGALRGNPGDAAFAYVISRDGEPPIEEADCLGQMTYNQAEYTALIRALEHALELGANHRVIVHSDSELMVKQMNGEYRVKNEDLRGLYEQACSLRKRFEGAVTIRHVRRRTEQARRRVVQRSPRRQALRHAALPPWRRKSRKSPRPSSVREEGLICLREAATAWSRGSGQPTPEQVWQRLTEILKRHGVKLSLVGIR